MTDDPLFQRVWEGIAKATRCRALVCRHGEGCICRIDARAALAEIRKTHDIVPKGETVVIPHEGVCNDRDRKMGAGG